MVYPNLLFLGEVRSLQSDLAVPDFELYNFEP